MPLKLSSNPSQLVFVQLDTGSSDLWITSAACSTAQCRDGKVLKFDSERSGSFRPIEVDVNGSSLGSIRKRADKVEVPFSIVYDDTTYASGSLVSDTVGFADLSVGHQAFALVNATNATLGEQGISGVFGLGFPRGSVVSRSLMGYHVAQVRTTPLMTSLLQTVGESYPMFGMYLTTDGGRMTTGAVDPTVLGSEDERSQVEWYNVYPFPSGDTSLPANDTLNVEALQLGSYVQWVLPLTAVGVAGTPASLTPLYPGATLALIDSGSSSILGPASDVASLFSSIRNSRHVGGGRFVVPCDTTDRLYFSFGGRNLTLLPTDYIIGPDAQQPYLCFAWPAAAPTDADGVGWILGTPFLRAVYSLFSIGINAKEPPKIGFYPLRQPANATQSKVVFRPQPTREVASFVTGDQATSVDSVLPNSLVSLRTANSRPYFFANATTTPSVGLLPTMMGAPSSYTALLPTATGGRGDLPVIESSSTPLPVPSNPAVANGAAERGGWDGRLRLRLRLLMMAVMVVMMVM